LPGLARFLEERRPDAAVLLNPLNTDARVRAMTLKLPRAGSPDDFARLEAEATRAIASNRLDARLFSILGEIKVQQGDEDARRYVAQALRLSKTETYALERSIVWALEDGRTADAVSEINTLLRRWPERFGQVSNAFPAILSDQHGFAAVTNALYQSPPWRGALFQALSRTSHGTLLAEQLLTELETAPLPPTSGEIAAIISGYIRQQDYQTAHRLFLFSLSEEERKHAGYVYNGSFAPIALGRPFDWTASARAGVEIALPAASATQLNAGAKLRFLNAPLKEIGLQQTILLPPGNYRISTTVTGRALELPKGLFWTVSCATPGKRSELARLDLPEGSFERRTLTADLVVPRDCKLQALRLATGLIAESWRFRYRGALSIHEIRIEKTAA
jgi:hypothetical protein